jgi:hypothetical protein
MDECKKLEISFNGWGRVLELSLHVSLELFGAEIQK